MHVSVDKIQHYQDWQGLTYSCATA